MAKMRRTRGGMIEIVRSRREKLRDASIAAMGDMGEILEYIKKLEKRVAALEGKKGEKPAAFSMEKKLARIDRLKRPGRVV